MFKFLAHIFILLFVFISQIIFVNAIELWSINELNHNNEQWLENNRVTDENFEILDTNSNYQRNNNFRFQVLNTRKVIIKKVIIDCKLTINPLLNLNNKNTYILLIWIIKNLN